MSYTVEVIKVGQSLVPGPEVYWMSHWQKMEQLYFYIVLIRGEGKTILINTGTPSKLSALNEKWEHSLGPEGRLERRPEEKIETILSSRNLKPSEIDFVLITPLQAYATSNIPLFTNATVCISKRGWIEDYHEPLFPLHVEPELRIPLDVMAYLEKHPDRLHLMEDNEEVIPGIQAKWVGTHHRSSMAYSIDTSHGKVIISDCFFKYENIEKLHPLGIQESMEECFAAYAWINANADIAIPLYDPEVLERYPRGLVS